MPAFQMEWRDVLFASYPINPESVAPHVPDSLAVDTFEGDAYLSVVPFVIETIRPAGLPAALGLTTPELNLRTYVTAEASDGGTAPGVYFFNLDVDDLLGVVGARLFNQLPYYLAEMDIERGDPIRFESRRRTPGARPCRFSGTYWPDGPTYRPDADSVEHFLVERYRYFTEGQDGSLYYADIEHDPWTLRPAGWDVMENTLFATNGFEEPDSDPLLAYSHGVEVWASTSKRWGE